MEAKTKKRPPTPARFRSEPGEFILGKPGDTSEANAAAFGKKLKQLQARRKAVSKKARRKAS